MHPHEYALMESSESSHWWFVAKRIFIDAIIPKNHYSRILDVGCGTGEMTTFLNDRGSVTRIENSRYAQQYLRAKRIPYIDVSITAYPIDPNAYDLICFFDVLYHRSIVNDVNVLQEAHTRLKKNGLLCVTDCAIPQLWSNHDVLMHARERYTKKDIEQKIISSGFTILRSSYIYFCTFPFFVIQRLLNKYISFETVKTPPTVLNSFLILLCSFEAKLLQKINFPIGSSVIILAQKL